MRRFNLISALLLGMTSVASLAAPVVISQNGATVSAAPYLQQVSVNPQALITHIPKAKLEKLSRLPVLKEQTLPVMTANMKPGIVKPHKVDVPYLPGKVFLIGSDQLSKRWLAQHKAQLIKLKATGLLVQVATPAQLQTMQQLAKPLMLTPVSGFQIGKRLNLKHYPVLISSTQVDQ